MHSESVLRRAQDLVNNSDPRELSFSIQELVKKNKKWRGEECLNLVAAESPTSISARQMLSSEVGTRISGGHIGRENRYYTGMDIIDELEAICIESLKSLFECKYADHRVLSGMHACQIAYASISNISDSMMTLSQDGGGDTSNMRNGPPGIRGLDIHSIPFDVENCEILLEDFKKKAEKVRPSIVSLGQTMTLFEMPIKSIVEIIKPWGGKLYFDAAHQAGLIAGGQFQNPLLEGGLLMTGSSGKTFSGPQGGLILWNESVVAEKITESIFPVMTGSHQVNRVASLAITVTELLKFGKIYMREIVRNAKSLARELDASGFKVLYKNRDFTNTHQVMLDVTSLGGGEQCVRQLEESNIIANKMPLPTDDAGNVHNPSGIRLGLVELSRLGMNQENMKTIASFFRRILIEKENKKRVKDEVVNFKEEFLKIFYSHETGYPRYILNEKF